MNLLKICNLCPEMVKFIKHSFISLYRTLNMSTCASSVKCSVITDDDVVAGSTSVPVL